MKQKLDDKNERLKNRMNVVFLMYGDDFAHLFMTTSLKTFKDFISYRKYYNDNFDRAIQSVEKIDNVPVNVEPSSCANSITPPV